MTVPFDEQELAALTATNRWAATVKLDLDVETVRTWDRGLPRDKRILVPVDVQAMVVPAADPEATVAITGTANDVEPFASGAPRAPGVHLHWAMPDALLRGRHDADASALVMPALPDRWVVIRCLLPEGGRLVQTRGWIVDAAKGTVSALTDYSGTTPDAVDGTPTYAPLDGQSGGTLMWSATYEGAQHRFTLHDDLSDLPQLEQQIAPQGFHNGRASYTVAGWWADASHDPVASCASRGQLADTLASFGWYISPEADDAADESLDPRILKLRTSAGLTSPAGNTPVVQVDKYSEKTTVYSEIAPVAGAAVASAALHYIGPGATHYHSLLHGSVLGVPIAGTISGTDDRPNSATITTAIGLDLDDVTAALAAPAFGVTPDKRQAAERLMAAFTSGMLARIETPDGIRDIEEREHADGFWSFAGKPLPGSVDDRLRAEDSIPLGPTAVGRKARTAAAGDGGFATGKAARETVGLRSEVSWANKYVQVKSGVSIASTFGGGKRSTTTGHAPTVKAGASRTVPKPAPRMFRPAPAMVALRDLKPNPRHHGDGLYDAQGLRCRWPGECTPGFQGVLDPAAILPTLSNGAIPEEVLVVVREAVTLDPYGSAWLARAGQPEASWPAREARIAAEHIRLFGADMTYDGSGATGVLRQLGGGLGAARQSSWSAANVSELHAATEFAVQVAGFSFVAGATPSPVSITTWRQPWVPLYVEWKVRLVGGDTLDGWVLDGLDMSRAEGDPAPETIDRTFTGRSPITLGIAKSLSTAMSTWLDAENARDAATPSQSQLDEADEATFAQLRNLIAPLDLVSTSLDGVREQLLGIDYVDGSVLRQPPADNPDAPPMPVASGLPTPLFGGRLEVVDLRAVDAFGRVLEIPIDSMRTTMELELPEAPSTIALKPRVQHGARWLFRLIDPGYPLAGDPADAPEAYVDQIAGADSVTPISGYLLPDHMDESLETFDRFGSPIGELSHDAVSEAVMWEPAPGRAVPPDAGPSTGIPGEFGPHAQHIALLASGLIHQDVVTRHSAEPATRSALSALLRAIDTTLWSIDTFQSLGTPTIAGLVGRPVAVVRATLMLDLDDDLDEVTITEAGGADARRAAFDAMDAYRFPIHVGDLGRSDDSVLGFFIDDDYTRFHVVDKVVASSAFDTGQHRGFLGLLGEGDAPAVDPIEHPYIDEEDTLLVKPGQVVRLTILMLPAGNVNLTTAIVPRKALTLADDWTATGLRKMVPSLRVGPVLVDPAEIHLPKVASLGDDQNFIRRTGPLTWKDDPIVAATSAALLPKMPHEAQEGWIHVAPKTDDQTSGGGS